jgi:hypothetical protein
VRPIEYLGAGVPPVLLCSFDVHAEGEGDRLQIQLKYRNEYLQRSCLRPSTQSLLLAAGARDCLHR